MDGGVYLCVGHLLPLLLQRGLCLFNLFLQEHVSLLLGRKLNMGGERGKTGESGNETRGRTTWRQSEGDRDRDKDRETEKDRDRDRARASESMCVNTMTVSCISPGVSL